MSQHKKIFHAFMQPFIKNLQITTFGGSYAISLCQNNKNGKFIIVERIPNWIEKINSKFSIYTLLGKDFYYFDKYNWKNLEVRSDKVQKVIEEQSFDSAKDMLDYFIKLNKIEYYKYPYRPDFIPQDDSDLIITAMNIWKMGNEDAFEILIKYHPNLKIKVKEFLNTNNISSVI